MFNLARFRGVTNILSRKYSLDSIIFTSSSSKEEVYDLIVIGGGIIGTAVSREILQKNSRLKVAIVEKEDESGTHQSSHNSGVIHSGLYYKPSSLKAELCVEGSKMIVDYCNHKNIPYVQCGKLLLANSRCEIRVLESLYTRALENAVPGIELLKDKSKINKIQPNSEGVQALWSPATANVDWGVVTNHFLDDFAVNGGNILYNFKVTDIKHSGDKLFPIAIVSKKKTLKTKYLICCSGLHSEKVAKLFDAPNKGRNISFRVQYMLLEDDNPSCKINTNVYEVPDMEAPFLGVHFSPRPDGRVLLGPSALPAFREEGYRTEHINLVYLKNVLSYCGFQKMALKNIPKCVNQVAKTVCPEVQHRALKRLVKTLKLKDIVPGPSAVQTQMIDTDGRFVDDFLLEFFEGDGLRKRIINCRFLPSPAASSSMAIGKLIGDRFFNQYNQDVFA